MTAHSILLHSTDLDAFVEWMYGDHTAWEHVGPQPYTHEHHIQGYPVTADDSIKPGSIAISVLITPTS